MHGCGRCGIGLHRKKKEFVEKYRHIKRNSGTKSEQHSDTMTEFNQTFSTLIAIDMCAGGDFLKWESVLDKEVGDVFTFLNYRCAKGYAERAEFEFRQRKAKR